MLKAIAALTTEERKKFFTALIPIASDSGYVVESQFGRALRNAAINAARPKSGRPRDDTRLGRGFLILRFHWAEGISWQRMPFHVIKNHPDWFPQYKLPLTDKERETFGQRLRKMARDAKASIPDPSNWTE